MRSRCCLLVCTYALALGLSAGACGQDDDPEGARALWTKINAGPGFRSWARAPGYATRRPSFTAHADAVEIWLSSEMVSALAPSMPSATPLAEWPVGSIVVKEGFTRTTGDSRKLVAVMEKRAGGWFWAEYDDGGESKYSGRPSVCLDCHDNRKAYSDWVYSFELPR
ncbi:MAG: uncharacterized protein JWP87_6462 [Labilithrix sp.]|nr:uncharacterized protein [Labilithrix sp.]